MNWILRLLWLAAGNYMQNKVVDHAKRKALVAYIQVLASSRRLVIVALLAFFILNAMTLAFFGALVSGILLWEQDFEFKMQVLFGLCLGIMALPALGLLVVLSERLWYKASGAEKMFEDVTRKAG